MPYLWSFLRGSRHALQIFDHALCLVMCSHLVCGLLNARLCEGLIREKLKTISIFRWAVEKSTQAEWCSVVCKFNNHLAWVSKIATLLLWSEAAGSFHGAEAVNVHVNVCLSRAHYNVVHSPYWTYPLGKLFFPRRNPVPHYTGCARTTVLVPVKGKFLWQLWNVAYQCFFAHRHAERHWLSCALLQRTVYEENQAIRLWEHCYPSGCFPWGLHVSLVW